MKPDERGWYWHERQRIRLGWSVFWLLDKVWFRPLNWLTRGHFFWAHESSVWLTFASWGWLVDELRRGDMPEHQRIGGEWR